MLPHEMRSRILNFVHSNLQIPQLKFIAEDPEGFTYKEIGDTGFINYLYRVQSADQQHSIVLKYGELLTKRGEGDVISLDRQNAEYDSLVLLSGVVPNNVVRTYCFDDKHHIIAMEDLSHMTILSEKILSGDFDTATARHIGKALAQLHMSTSRHKVDPDVWQQWDDVYGGNTAGTMVVMEYAFRGTSEQTLTGEDPVLSVSEAVKPVFIQYYKNVTENGYWEKIEAVFRNKQCMMQGDCHPNAIFVKEDQVKFVDFELVGLCDPAMNVGYVIGTYVLWAYQTAGKQGMSDAHIKARLGAKHLLEAYLDEQEDYEAEEERKEFIQKLVLISAVINVFYTSISNLPVMLRITDKDKVAIIKRSMRLMDSHMDISTIEDLYAAL